MNNNTMDNNEIEIRNALSAIRRAQLTQVNKTHTTIDVTSFVGPVGRGPNRDEIAKDAIIEYFRESYYDDCIILFEDEQ